MRPGRDEAPVTIVPSGPLDAEIPAPPSKSLTIRALAAAALAPGVSFIERPLEADDTAAMVEALRTLGIAAERSGPALEVRGEGGRLPAAVARLDLEDAGTPLRLLTAICCLGEGRFVLDGSERMRRRPVGDLIAALSCLGARVRSLRGDGCPPVEVEGIGLAGGEARLRGEVSSQFLSALLVAAPCASSDVTVEVEGRLVSRPYVDLTLDVMAAFGAQARREGYRRFVVPSGGYRPARYRIEGDASSAAYWFAAAAIAGGRVRVTGIPSASRQADLRFLDLLEAMGCVVRRDPGGIEVAGGALRGLEADLSDAPDLAPALAAVALFASGPTRIRGVAHLRVKESDRIEGIAACAGAMGARVAAGPDWVEVAPPGGGRGALRGADVDPRGDHRLAMAFALPGLALPGVRILDPGCAAKSYPDFFGRLEALGTS